MPHDITLCAGGDCPLKQFCYRHTTEVLGRQNFFGSLNFDFSTNHCQFFIKNDTYFGHIRLKAFKIWETNKLPDKNSKHYWQLAEDEFLLNI
jgi:hypothetical protein